MAMTDPYRRLRAIAARQRNLVTRADVLGCGFTDEHLRVWLRRGWLQRLHRGVYLMGATPPDWHQQLLAAVLAAGEEAMASARAAVVLWGLDGIGSAPVEITVPHDAGPDPDGAIVHRVRRMPRPVRRGAIPVTDVKRTLLDASAYVPPLVVIKAFESAYRKRLVTPAGMASYLESCPGKGVKGIGVLRSYLQRRGPGRAAGSPAEVEVLELLHEMGIEAPVRQFEIRLRDGRVVVVDLAWPGRRKAAEIQGYDGHSSPADVEADAERANAIQDAGWELRFYGARTAARRPAHLAAAIRRYLESPPPGLAAGTPRRAA